LNKLLYTAYYEQNYLLRLFHKSYSRNTYSNTDNFVIKCHISIVEMEIIHTDTIRLMGFLYKDLQNNSLFTKYKIINLIILYAVLSLAAYLRLLYSGKVWWGKSLANWVTESFSKEKFGEYQ